MKKILLGLVLLVSFVTFAQNEESSYKKAQRHDAYYVSNKKLGFTSLDSLFQMNMGLRIQSLASYVKQQDQSGVINGEVRRLRLKFDGFVLNPKFEYKMELGLAARDMSQLSYSADGKTVSSDGNIVLDAVFKYHPSKDLTLAFGQTKLPSNIQRVVSSGNMQFVDRTINNSRFNTDRDFGFFFEYGKVKKDSFYYDVIGAVTKGEGRNWLPGFDDGVCLSGKLELYPFGAFAKNGAYFEGDLEREKKPKLLVSGAFAQNNNAHRSQGQLGSTLYESRTMQSVFVDAVFKYNGWDARAAYMMRDADNPITINPDDNTKTQAVFVGYGYDTELSYVFPSNFQIAGRYSAQKVGSEIASKSPDMNEYSIGVSKYLSGHKLKIQADCSYDQYYKAGVTTDGWNVRFQVEIGI